MNCYTVEGIARDAREGLRIVALCRFPNLTADYIAEQIPEGELERVVRTNGQPSVHLSNGGAVWLAHSQQGDAGLRGMEADVVVLDVLASGNDDVARSAQVVVLLAGGSVVRAE